MAGRDALQAEEMGRMALRLSDVLDPVVYDPSSSRTFEAATARIRLP